MPKILPNYSKNKRRGTSKFLQITSKIRTQGVTEILSDCFKNNTQKDPEDSFKLNTSNPKERDPRDSFELLQQTGVTVSRDSFKFLPKQKASPRFFNAISKLKHTKGVSERLYFVLLTKDEIDGLFQILVKFCHKSGHI